MLQKWMSNAIKFGIFFKLNHTNRNLLKPKTPFYNQISTLNLRYNVIYPILRLNSRKYFSTTPVTPLIENIKLPFNREKLDLYLNSLSTEYQEILNISPNNATMKRFNYLEPVLKIWDQIKSGTHEVLQLQKLINELENEKSDKEMLKLAEEDMSHLFKTLENNYFDLINEIVPPEEIDDMDIIVELTAGVGGQEAMLFTQEMTNMYKHFAQFKGWSCETLDYDTTDIGGVRHATLNICGHLACKYMKYECGVHRVQRVPKTEKSGRIHTSTMTVAILPQPTNIQVSLDPKDLKLETMRASGAGGQHVNKTESAVRVIHIPSGFVVHCQISRSQHKNQEYAKTKLRAMLYEKQLNEETSKQITDRKVQVGNAGRSEKVRTYNYVQDRISDHRLSKNYYNIDEFLAGKEVLNKLIEDLMITTKFKTLNNILNQFKNVKTSS